MWPLVACGLLYLSHLVASGEWRALLFRPRDVRGAIEMQKYYLGLRKEHPPQGKHNPLQKLAYTFIVLLGVLAVLTGLALYKPVQFGWLTWLFGGFQAAPYWHFWPVGFLIAFPPAHWALGSLLDPRRRVARDPGGSRGRF